VLRYGISLALAVMKEDRAWPKMSIRQLQRDACLIRSQF